uniref:SWIM-type domain-containing protein n=1 Tax=Tanacetum cinerariifolium TaxID=118510 RepID=A0A6L2KM62_TANCI|nr:hypothetical protein [Tanacetum cinerariifolium]
MSRAPYSRRTKGDNDVIIDRSFWLTLLGLNDGGWLTNKVHLDAWFDLMWIFGPSDADWAIASSYFYSFVMRGDTLGWVCNGVRYPIIWEDVEQVFFSINEPKKHYCHVVLHIMSSVITLYDSLGAHADETRKWWKYAGTNLLAIGMDGNNQILPLATWVSQGETGKSCTWFLTKLEEQIGEPPNLCIISERHVAIILACGTVFDNSFHGYCDRHLMMNYNLKGKKLRGIFLKACKAYTMKDFDKAISKLCGYTPEAVRKLEEVVIEKWSRAYCPRSRYKYMTSNNVESINSLTKIVRRVPITVLVESVRTFCKGAPENELADWAAAKVDNRMLNSTNWTVNTIYHLKLFQVYNKREVHQVDLVAFECTCRKWQLFGLPCGHVCAVCRVSDTKPWQAPNDLQLVLPPVMNKRPAGRPKNKDHILSTNEAPTLASCTSPPRSVNPYTRILCFKHKRGRNTYPKRPCWMKRDCGMAKFTWIDMTWKQHRTMADTCTPQSNPKSNVQTQLVDIPVTKESSRVKDWQVPCCDATRALPPSSALHFACSLQLASLKFLDRGRQEYYQVVNPT